MKKIKSIILAVSHMKYLKYVIVAIIGTVLVGFVGDSSIWAHLRNKQQISELEEEIQTYNEKYNRDQAQIDLLDNNPKAMEHIARERYYMKANDEDIFILSDDERTPKFIEPTINETAE